MASGFRRTRAALPPSTARCKRPDGLLLLPGFSIQFLVDPVGFEPTTFSMPLRRAPKLRHGPSLVQTPKCWGKPRSSRASPEVLGQAPEVLGQVDLAGLEPATSSVRLMRAPNCATGPRLGLRIVLRSRNRCQECRLKPRSLELDRRADNFLTPPLAGHGISLGNAPTMGALIILEISV